MVSAAQLEAGNKAIAMLGWVEYKNPFALAQDVQEALGLPEVKRGMLVQLAYPMMKRRGLCG